MPNFFVDTIDEEGITIKRNRLDDMQHTHGDEEIISGLEGRDVSGSVNALYQMFYKDIIDFVQIKGGTETDGGDIFQDAILILIEEIQEGNFRGESKLKTFLFGIARNLWLMELRTRERRKKREEVYMNTEPTVEDVKYFDKGSGDLERLFSEVGDVCKKILVGFYYDSKSMKMLLKEFDFKNEQVLRNRKNLCMKKLKDLLSSNPALLNSLKTFYIYE